MFVVAAPLYPLEKLVTHEILHGVIVALVVVTMTPSLLGVFKVISFNRP